MEVLRDWIVGIVAAAFLTAIAQAVVPEGSVKRVTRMAGGLVMILAVVRPLLGIGSIDLSQKQTQYEASVEATTAHVSQTGDRLVQQLIEEKTAAYILTEVQTRELSLSVAVRADTPRGDSYPVPYSVRLRGRFSPQEKESLSQWIVRNVGIDSESQEWISTEQQTEKEA